MSGAGAPGRRFVMMRFAGLPCAVLSIGLLVGMPARAAAQEKIAVTGDGIFDAAAAVRVAPDVSKATQIAERRPTALVPLYASFITLQILDLHSTHYALEHGAIEANPAVKGFAGNTVGMTAVKAAGTAGVIFISEKLRLKNKAAAIGLMIATNSAMTWVVQHNYRAVR
jgi:hypothetical protein